MAKRGNVEEDAERYEYEDELVWAGRRRATVIAKSAPPLDVAAPPEFGGESGVWNPEQLLLAAANACLMNTFFALAGKARIEVTGYSCGGSASLTKDPEGGYAITRIRLRPVVLVSREEDLARTRGVLGTAERRCLVARSLRYETVVEPTVSLWRPQGAALRVAGGAAP